MWLMEWNCFVACRSGSKSIRCSKVRKFVPLVLSFNFNPYPANVENMVSS